MIDEHDFNNSYYEHLQATTTLGIEEIVEKTVNDPSLEDPFGSALLNLDLDKLLEEPENFNEPSLENY